MTKRTTFIILISIFYSCKPTSPPSSQGVVIKATRIKTNEKDGFVMPRYFKDGTAWFKDSFAIVEVQEVFITTDTNFVESHYIKTRFYNFIDLRTKSVYNYKEFSPKSPLVAKFLTTDKYQDSIHMVGWTFYAALPKSYMGDDEVETLSDTIMNGISYKRVRTEKIVGDNQAKAITIGYLRCDKKKSLFHIDKAFDDKSDCPISKIQIWDVGKNIWFQSEINFVRDKLTKEEMEVFTAWEKYAKENPVHR